MISSRCHWNPISKGWQGKCPLRSFHRKWKVREEGGNSTYGMLNAFLRLMEHQPNSTDGQSKSVRRYAYCSLTWWCITEKDPLTVSSPLLFCREYRETVIDSEVLRWVTNGMFFLSFRSFPSLLALFTRLSSSSSFFLLASSSLFSFLLLPVMFSWLYSIPRPSTPRKSTSLFPILLILPASPSLTSPLIQFETRDLTTHIGFFADSFGLIPASSSVSSPRHIFILIIILFFFIISSLCHYSLPLVKSLPNIDLAKSSDWRGCKIHPPFHPTVDPGLKVSIFLIHSLLFCSLHKLLWSVCSVCSARRPGNQQTKNCVRESSRWHLFALQIHMYHSNPCFSLFKKSTHRSSLAIDYLFWQEIHYSSGSIRCQCNSATVRRRKERTTAAFGNMNSNHSTHAWLEIIMMGEKRLEEWGTSFSLNSHESLPSVKAWTLVQNLASIANLIIHWM